MLSLINLPEGFHECKCDAEALHEIWDHIKDYEKLFTEEEKWDEYVFARNVLKPGCYLLETDGGIVVMRNIKKRLCGNVLFSFWDHKLSDKVNLLKEVFLYFFLLFELQRIEVFLPDFCRALRRFYEDKLKFIYEGRLRKRMWYKGNLTDVLVLSLLREEVK